MARAAEGDVALTVRSEIDTWLAALDDLPVAVSVVGAGDADFLWHNKASIRILGLRSVAAPGEQHGAIHPDGRPYGVADYPLWRFLNEGVPAERVPLLYRRKDGGLLRLVVSASRFRVEGRDFGICTFEDVTAEHDARLELQVAAERVQLALDAGAIVGTWIWNIPDDLITADERFAQSFGIDPERCRRGLSSLEVLQSVHPEDRPGVEAAVWEAIARGGAYRRQYRVKQADGEYRWVEASGRVEQGRFPGVLLDIEASKQAEEARNLLMREVDHRARNALTMVQSVVRLTDAVDPARFREEVVGRIDAMARAQASLSRSNWQGGVLADVIRDELATYALEEHFLLSGPHLSLRAEQVQPLSMIVHEMVTNAVKHGALSCEGGRVEVSWRRMAAGEAVLVWRERGGPAVKAPTRTGFGTRLIERLSRQLGGGVDMEWRDAGVIARLNWTLAPITSVLPY